MKRRRFRPEFKLQCVLDVLSGRKNPAQICREHNLSESSLSRWRKQFVEGALKIFSDSSFSENSESQRISELERLVGLHAARPWIKVLNRLTKYEYPII